MIHPARAAAVAAVLLAGCPLPQPLPDYPEGEPITPPRIVVDDTIRSVTYSGYTVAYCPTCQTAGKVLADNTTSKFLK